MTGDGAFASRGRERGLSRYTRHVWYFCCDREFPFNVPLHSQSRLFCLLFPLFFVLTKKRAIRDGMCVCVCVWESTWIVDNASSIIVTSIVCVAECCQVFVESVHVGISLSCLFRTYAPHLFFRFNIIFYSLCVIFENNVVIKLSFMHMQNKQTNLNEKLSRFNGLILWFLFPELVLFCAFMFSSLSFGDACANPILNTEDMQPPFFTTRSFYSVIL